MVNWASTWANQTTGSAGQKGGSLMLTAATVGVGEGDQLEPQVQPSRKLIVFRIVSSVRVTNVTVLLLYIINRTLYTFDRENEKYSSVTHKLH